MSDARRVKKMEKEIKELKLQLNDLKKQLWSASGFDQCVILCKKNRASFKVKKLTKQVKHLKQKMAEGK